MVSLLNISFAFLANFASVTYSLTYLGCFAPPTDLQYNTRFVFQSLGYCERRCTGINRLVVGLANGTDCLCGNSVPPSINVVEDVWCNSPCAGYHLSMCGGQGFFSVYLLAELDTPERPPHETSSQLIEPAATSIALPKASVQRKSSQFPLRRDDML
ncbi:hypothetical protein F4819DRAFT_25218 [Hypoxylon fuscum]|nr:hypothetical protein F4819DRAFT_25218 [Hypoxylon fuscum]